MFYSSDIPYGQSQCGWRSIQNIQAVDTKYIWIGVPLPTATGCIAQKLSPNAAPYVDAAINVLANMLVETVTNPLFTAFYYAIDADNFVGVARQCQNNFVNPVRMNTGAYYNMAVNGRNYYIQSIWNLKTKTCSLF